MNPTYQWFQNNLDLIFFVYGVTFVILGMSILLQPKKESEFKLANVLWYFVGYCLIHSPSDFINMWMFSRGTTETISIFAQILTYISYIFLFEFGRRILRLANKNVDWWVLPAIYLIIIFISLLSNNFWVTIDILIGYFIRAPAGIMAGVGFFLYYNSEKEKLAPLKVKKYFYSAGIAFLAWSFFCGIVRSKGDFFPSDIFNIESFFMIVNVPVYVFRSICGLIITLALIGSLKIFDWESKKRLKESEEKFREAYMLADFYKDLFAHDISNILQIIELSTSNISKLSNKLENEISFDDLAKIIDKQIKRGGNMVTNICKLSQLSETKKNLRSIEIFKIINETVKFISDSYPEKQIDIQIQSYMNEIFILANEFLQDVFENLLINAINYNQNPKIEIIIKISNIKKNGILYVKIEINDNGIGISKELKDQLFNRIVKRERKVRGMGLGLMLVKKIINSFNGKIWVEDRIPGDNSKGSNFIILLPRMN